MNYDWPRLSISILLFVFVAVCTYGTAEAVMSAGTDWFYSLAPISLELIGYVLCLKFLIWEDSN